MYRCPLLCKISAALITSYCHCLCFGICFQSLILLSKLFLKKLFTFENSSENKSIRPVHLIQAKHCTNLVLFNKINCNQGNIFYPSLLETVRNTTDILTIHRIWYPNYTQIQYHLTKLVVLARIWKFIISFIINHNNHNNALQIMFSQSVYLQRTFNLINCVSKLYITKAS